MKISTVFGLMLLFCHTLFAQGMKDILNKAKTDVQTRVAQKTTEKVDQTIDRGIDRGIDKALDKTLYKLFPKPAGSVFTNNPGSGPNPVSTKKAASTNGKVNANGEILIMTNIKCAAGKKALEQNLVNTPGVSTALIDTDTGMLYLTLTGTITGYDDIVDIIRKNGFTADGKKSTAGVNNCK